MAESTLKYIWIIALFVGNMFWYIHFPFNYLDSEKRNAPIS